MKKIFLTVLFATLCMSFVSTTVLAHGEQENENEMQPSVGQMQIQPFMGQPTTTMSGVRTEADLKQKEMELKKRELKVNSTTGNTGEALKNFDDSMRQSKLELQQKMNEAKKQRALCLQGRAQDLRDLEKQRRASASAMVSTCSQKNIQASFQKPTKPTLDGLSAGDKKAAVLEYQQSMKDFIAQIQAAVKECKTKAQQTQQDFREQMLTIKEQCSNTERTVLGLSTEIPYNIDPAVPQY